MWIWYTVSAASIRLDLKKMDFDYFRRFGDWTAFRSIYVVSETINMLHGDTTLVSLWLPLPGIVFICENVLGKTNLTVRTEGQFSNNSLDT